MKWILMTGMAFWAAGSIWADEGKVVKVFVLAGQSNMEGQGVVEMDHAEYYNGGKGNLVQTMAKSPTPERFAHLKDKDGKWTVRDDVFVRFQIKSGLHKGGLTVGFTGYGGTSHIGPELQIGHRLGDHFSEPVLLVKTAWGGKSLGKDFRPPGREGETGEFYVKMMAEIGEALKKMEEEFPELKGYSPEVAGFIWFQGWNDMFDESIRDEYADNLVQLVADVRKDLKAAELPVVIGELGNGGPEAGENMLAIRAAQREAAGRIKPEGSAVFVVTSGFARPKEESPNMGHGHHWFGNAESYFLIGDALGEAMVGLLK